MAEYTDLYCNSSETAEAVKAYLESENAQEDDPISLTCYVEKSTLRITYNENDCPRRYQIDAQLVGYRDGLEARGS